MAELYRLYDKLIEIENMDLPSAFSRIPWTKYMRGTVSIKDYTYELLETDAYVELADIIENDKDPAFREKYSKLIDVYLYLGRISLDYTQNQLPKSEFDSMFVQIVQLLELTIKNFYS